MTHRPGVVHAACVVILIVSAGALFLTFAM
jgi:hypothetical protein